MEREKDDIQLAQSAQRNSRSCSSTPDSSESEKSVIIMQVTNTRD